MGDFINMDIDIIREYIEADPTIIKDIKAIQDYRNLRTLQAFYARLCYLYDNCKDPLKAPKIIRNSGALDRDSWGEEIIRLDRDRRDTHNAALSAFNNIISIGIKKGLDYIYLGPRLSSMEAHAYKFPERRANITDAMLQLLSSIEDSVLIATEKNSDLVNIKQDMNRFNNTYNVKKSLTEDESDQRDGGIDFFDFKNKFNSNEDT